MQHNDGTGGENLLRTEPNNEGNSGVAYTIADETFHNDKVYYRNETSQDTTKYSGWTWAIPRNEFDYGDVFTLSFYAKGTSGAEIRTYFAGGSGYISNRRLSSNSDVDGDRVIGSYGDGATRFHLTSDWKRYYVTYQLHTTATTPTQNKSIHIRTFGASTDIESYISNVKLERGYYATDYDRHTRDNEPLYFPTEVSLPTTTTSANRRKFIHPPYKFKNIPNWTVEGEIVRGRIAVADSTGGTHQAFAVMANLIGVEIIDKHLSITLPHGCGDALDETFVLSFLNDKTVHNDLNIMILVAIHLHACNDLLNDTIHAYIKIALATYGVEELFIVTLAILNERSQQINLFAHEVLEEKIQNLLLSILHHPFTLWRLYSTDKGKYRRQIFLSGEGRYPMGSTSHRRTVHRYSHIWHNRHPAQPAHRPLVSNKTDKDG